MYDIKCPDIKLMPWHSFILSRRWLAWLKASAEGRHSSEPKRCELSIVAKNGGLCDVIFSFSPKNLVLANSVLMHI